METFNSMKRNVRTANEERWIQSSVHPEILVSSKGRVKARGYQLVTKDANKDCFRIYNVPDQILTPVVGSSGDAIVRIPQANGVTVTENLAFLVAKEFVPNENPERFTLVKAKDHNKANTDPSNLYWDGFGPFAR